MWRVPLAFALLVAVLFTVTRISNHFEIAKDGGIRKRYNSVFSFLYRLPGSRLIFETKSLVKFNIDTQFCKLSFILNYTMEMLDIKCIVKYQDDTAFKNGTTLKWTVSKPNRGDEVLKKMKADLSKLPGLYNFIND